ncbi:MULTISPECIES: hypothetical protein [Clostridium]|nr:MULTISPECIES: hypothetical protein [Clostridium]KIU07701.1 hypothetical protein SC08_Contig83orf01622 [Clostridium butyricum]MBA8967532.1 hypothetical protein [Clostridium butyricum]MBA8971401.1 hypothetical protein [Clostridium butyricum]MBC2428060.1 hypothetical protein [Clostridium butyricum]MDU0324048.1 hypothetical protein [Clostridium butyricum]
MNLENSIKDVITKKLEDGTVEKLVSEQLEKGVVNALDSLFRSYGDVTKVIEEKVKCVMVPYLENYDYSKYITKLDSVLVDVLKNSALDNKKLLENFKTLMVGESIPEEIKMSDIFKKWCEYCENNVDKNELDFDYEGGYINVSFSVEDVSNDWSSYKTLISLRYLNDFDMLLLQVSQGYENIVLDSDGDSDEIFIEYEE